MEFTLERGNEMQKTSVQNVEQTKKNNCASSDFKSVNHKKIFEEIIDSLVRKNTFRSFFS